jgi:hypothetical protein
MTGKEEATKEGGSPQRAQRKIKIISDFRFEISNPFLPFVSSVPSVVNTERPFENSSQASIQPFASYVLTLRLCEKLKRFTQRRKVKT